MDAETLTKAEDIARKLATELGEPALRLAADVVQIEAIVTLALCAVGIGLSAPGWYFGFRLVRYLASQVDDGLAFAAAMVGGSALAGLAVSLVVGLASPIRWVSAFSGELGLALRVVRAVTGG